MVTGREPAVDGGGGRRPERQRARGLRKGLIRPQPDLTGIGTRPYGARTVLGRTVSVVHSLWAAAEGTTVARIFTAGRSPITMSHLRLIVAAALALVLVLPATVLAATVDVGGTVTNTDGSAAVGAEVTILVQGTDQIFAATTDENGAWALQLDAEPGAILDVQGLGQATTSEPDAEGCTTTTTPSGQTTATIPADGPVPPIDFPLNDLLTGSVCATLTPPDTGGGTGGGGNGGGQAPAEQKPDTAAVTPPSTDTLPVAGATTPGSATFLLLGGLIGLTGVILAATVGGHRHRR